MTSTIIPQHVVLLRNLTVKSSRDIRTVFVLLRCTILRKATNSEGHRFTRFLAQQSSRVRLTAKSLCVDVAMPTLGGSSISRPEKGFLPSHTISPFTR